jgi:hypothetical protein
MWLKIQFAEKLANQLLDEHNLTKEGWSFKWNNSKRNFGLCRYSSKTIELSRVLSEHQTSDQIKDTIVHEIAHALTPGSGHGQKWKLMAMKLGIEPNRLGSLSEDGREAMKNHAPWVLVFGSEVIRTYYKKPTRTINKLSSLYLTGRKQETIGKLKVVPNPQYKAKA